MSNTTETEALHPLMTTIEAAKALRREPNTLRCWSMRGNGPVKPIRTRRGAPLLWRRADIERLINGDAIEPKAGFEPATS